LKASLKKYDLKLKLSEVEIAHMFLPRPNVIYTYVVENYESKKITDFFSFYSLPSSVLKKAGHTHE
jgi:glycylpeptide N-tetradecanoyltransferase